MPNFNADCSEGFYDAETLAELRYDILIGLGYGARASNPPPGMADTVDNALKRAQQFLYRRYKALATERFYSWTMTVGERFYGIRANGEACTKKLDAYRITGVWIEDLNGTWLPVHRGINPRLYTSATQNGLPARYEVRQEIEVFPAPDVAYTLWVKGHFGLERFTEDTDHATVDSTLLYMWALANLKNHYGAADARDVATQAQAILRDLVGGSHGDARYIPGTPVNAPQTQPYFPSMGEGDA